MEEPKKFSRIGARNIKLVGIQSGEIANSSNCFCPVCGGGPMDGCTGMCMEASNSDNSFGFDDFSISENFNKMPGNLTPQPGDPTICCYCASLVSYAEDDQGVLTLRLFRRDEINKWKDQPDAWRALMKMREFVESRIELARIQGDRRYAGSTIKHTI